MEIKRLDGFLLRKIFIGAYHGIESNKELINNLNVFPVPDGDTGINMALTMKSAIKDIENKEDISKDEVLNIVSKGSLMGARGNSGVILSQLIRGFTKELLGKENIDSLSLTKALKKGSDLAYKAVMKPIEGTILTVAKGCANKAIEICHREENLLEFLRQIIKYGYMVLEKTPDMLPALKEAEVVDSGGQGLMSMLEGALLMLEGKEYEISSDVSHVNKTEKILDIHDFDGEIEFGYCTEFLIIDTDRSAEEFRSKIKTLGDSILVVDGDGVIKTHIHTNNPGKALEEALKFGNIIDIKIDNMRNQNKNLNKSKKILKKYGIIAISVGEGINRIFKELNVDEIILGGQTMNPSTENILDKINSIESENIIIFPNNSNIMLSANQAKEISDKNVLVIPSKTIPSGISGLLSFDENLEPEENEMAINKAIDLITTGEVTFSIKDTIIDGVPIKKKDIIGISGKKVVEVGKDPNSVVKKLISNILKEDSEIVTIFYGEDISEKEALNVKEALEKELPNMDIEMLSGGQPLYFYLVSVE